MIEVFRTNIPGKVAARKIVGLLSEKFPGTQINIDLHDCDKVLRVKGEHLDCQELMQQLRAEGFLCEVLEG